MPTIDDSVVRLSLDDSQFDKASNKTIKKLDELKNSLQFDGAVDGFKEIEKAARKTDLSPLEKGAEAVSLKFNALYTIADTMFRRIVNGAIDSGERLVKSLTIDNVAAGWDKYAQKTSAVQTIMASTSTQFEDTGEQMAYVEAQLEKLNWFTDETSYAFLDMVNNIGKFTSNGIALDKAATAMQGISNWAAISGAGIQGASMAMYNLSQAIGLGALTLQDWKSIELANMGTVEFKQMALEVAAARGEIQKLGDGIYKTFSGTDITIQTFRDSLSDKWFSADTLIDVLAKYGDFTNMLYELSELTDLSATPLIRYVNEYKAGTLDMQEAMTATGLSAEELSDWLEKLGADEMDLGRRAFAAAQEAKTFQEAIDATKEAVASGWMQSFEYIFGNYEEAKEIWSELAEGLYEVFVESGNMRNGLLRDWKELGGRTYLIDALRTIFYRLADGIQFVKDAFEEVFPPKIAEELVQMTKGFRDLIDLLTPSENTLNTVHNVLTLLFKIFQKIGQVSLVVIAGLEPIWTLLAQIGGAVIGLIGDIAGLLGLNLDKIFSADALTNLYNIIYAISSIVAALARGALIEVISILGHIFGFIDDIFKTYRAYGGGLLGFINAIAVNFKALFDRIKNGESAINGFFGGMYNFLVKIFDYVKSGDSIFHKFFNGLYTGALTVVGGIGMLFKTIFESFSGKQLDSNSIADFFKKIGAAVEQSGLAGNLKIAADAILNFVSALFGAVGGLNGVGANLQVAVSWIIEQFGILWNWVVSQLSNLTFRDVADVGLIIMIDRLIAAFRGLVSSFTGVSKALSGTLKSVGGFFDRLAGNGADSISKKINDFVSKTKYLQMAVAIGVMVNGLVELSKLPTDQLGIAVAAISITTGLLIALMKTLEKLSKANDNERENSMKNAADNMIKFAAGIGVLATAVRMLSGAVEKNGYGGLIAGVAGLGALMGELALFVLAMKEIGPSDEIAKVAAGLIIFATGLTLMAVPVSMFAKLNWEDWAQGIGGAAALLISFGAAAALMGKVNVGSILAAAAALDLMAIGLTAMAIPIFTLSKLVEDKHFDNALDSTVLLLIALSAACAAIGTFGGGAAGGAAMIAAGGAMVIIASAINSLADAIIKLEKANPWAFVEVLLLMGAAFAGLIGVGAIATGLAVGLAAVAAVIVSVGAAFALFALGVKILTDAAAEFVAICLVITAAGEALGEDFPAAVDRAVTNVELVIRSFLRMIPNLAADIAAAAFSLIIALKYGFIKALPDILNGLMIVGIGIFEVIARWGGPFVQALTEAINGMTPGIPDLLDAIGSFVEELFVGIFGILHHAVKGLFRGIWNFIFGEELGAEIAGFFIGEDISSGLEHGLEAHEEDLYNAGNEAAETAIEGMKDGAGTHSDSWKAIDIANDIFGGFSHTLTDLLPNFEDSGFETMANYFSGMTTGAKEGGDNIASILDSIYQMVGAKSDSITKAATKSTESVLKAQIKEGKLLGYDVSDLEAELASLGKETGSAYNAGVTNAVSNFGMTDTSSAKSASSAAQKVKTAAETIIESYKDALSELDYLDKKYKTEYDLWEILNIDVSEIDKKTAKLDLTNKEIENQIKRTQIAQEKYEKIAKAMGNTSAEARDAELEWINQQVALAKLQNETAELQNSIIEDAATQMELNQKNAEATYNLWVSTNQNASQVEQQQKKLEYTMQKLEYTGTKVTQATEKYNEALEKYGEEATETKEALNELLTIQKDYADLSAEVNEIQESIVDLGRSQAELALENKTLEYEFWLQTNKAASQSEKEAKKTEEILARYERRMIELTEATADYKKACEDFGEQSIEAAAAYQLMIQAQKNATETYAELRDIEKEHLEYLTEELSISLNKADLEDQLWSTMNENASELEKHSHNRLGIVRKQVYAQQELFLLEKEYQRLLAEEGEESQNTANAYANILSKQIEIAEYVNQLKDSEMQLLEIESKNIAFEQKRLSISESGWQAANGHASVAEQSAHSVEKMNYEMVLSMKELNNLSAQYNRQLERYGQNSEEARSAWEAYRNKQVEILQLQNERKALELEIIENELAMTSLVEKRAKSEYELWEALNQDASESEKKTKKLNYQMQTLDLATEKLRQASKKYNYALKMYGEEAKETQQLFNEMLDAQIEYANTYNELKTVQQDIITKNNEILEQLNYSEQLLDYGYNMWEKLYSDISDAQKIEAEIKKLGMDLTTQVARANYYGAEWKRAVAKYGEGSSEAQQAYLDYLEALYKAVDLQSSLEQKEKDLVAKREEDAQKIQDVWDEITAKDLVGGTSIYDELVEMGLSEAEIEAYVREKAGVIEDTIGAEMDFSIDHMQSKAEESLREWGMTWMDGVYTVADDVVTTAGDAMIDMTDIIADGAEEGVAAATKAMEDIDRIAKEGGENTTDTVKTGMSSVVSAINGGSSSVTNATASVIADATMTGVRMADQLSYQIGTALSNGIEDGIWSGRSGVINAMVYLIEDAIWAARREAEIFSPSHITTWMGTMLDAGFVKGIEQDAGQIALSMSRMIQNGIEATKKVVHTSNTLEFAGRMIADGIAGGFQDYSYNVLSVGKETLNSLLDDYDDMVYEAAGEGQWLLDALREYGFDETTHGMEFVVSLDAEDARTELERLFEQREADLDYYDELIAMRDRNAEKNQRDLSVQAERNAIERELNRIISSIESYEKSIEDFVNAGRAANQDDTIYGKKLEYVQNIYSSKPLSALDIYRNTNSQLLKFTAWR